jgi:hypothetical protein
MRPAIVHPEGNTSQAYLVDLHAVVHGDKAKHHCAYLRAIEIRHLRAGELLAIDGEIFPKPCQLEQYQQMARIEPQARGIHADAAAALLSMPLGHKMEITLGKPVELGAPKPQGWDQWKFIIAWCWSLWQDERARGPRDANGWSVWGDTKAAKHDSLELRWQVMKRMGYPNDLPAFRQACARMNLFVTESKR